MPQEQARYGVVVHPQVLHELSDPQRYPAKIQLQILKKILALSLDPRPSDSKKLEGSVYRATIGEYRVVYEIDDQASRVTVFLVAKRGDDEVYQRLAKLSMETPFLNPLFSTDVEAEVLRFVAVFAWSARSSDRGDAGPGSCCTIFTLMRLALLLRMEQDAVTAFPHRKKGGLPVRDLPVGTITAL